ncbi:DMT family transporter [Paenibacillus gansuensis]|uniref:DMT family transporter n=1 Tax=Paenibacillus gansuensis TaxID=306542 RepID=A0ABW5PHS4_9BACL
MLLGIILALIGGSLVGVQNMFNQKVNEKAGGWSTTALVLGMGFAASLVMGLFFEGRELFSFGSMQPWFWFSGLLGVGVVTCMVQGVKRLGATYGVAIAMASQLICALWWDSAGWFGLEQVPFTLQKGLGVLALIGGIIVFKLGGRAVQTRSSQSYSAGGTVKAES